MTRCAASNTTVRSFGAVLLLLVLAAPAVAQDKDAVRRLQQQMQKLQQQNVALEREKADLASKLAEAQKKAGEIEALKTEVTAVRRDAGRRTAELETLRSKTSSEQERQSAELAAAAKTNEQQRREIERLQALVAQTEQSGAKLQASLAERDRSLSTCETKNQAMLKTGREILDRLSDGRCSPPGPFAWEPVLKLGRARYERELEAYRDLLEDQRYLPGTTR